MVIMKNRYLLTFLFLCYYVDILECVCLRCLIVSELFRYRIFYKYKSLHQQNLKQATIISRLKPKHKAS